MGGLGFGECTYSDSLGFPTYPLRELRYKYASSLSLLSGDHMGDISKELATVLVTWQKLFYYHQTTTKLLLFKNMMKSKNVILITLLLQILLKCMVDSV